MCPGLRLAVDDLREIGDRRTGVQPRQHVIATRVLRQRRDARGLVVEITEDDRLRGTRLCARGCDLAVLNVAILEARTVLGAAVRCTQNVHFSITPFARTVTSGLSSMLSGSGQLSHSPPGSL